MRSSTCTLSCMVVCSLQNLLLLELLQMQLHVSDCFTASDLLGESLSERCASSRQELFACHCCHFSFGEAHRHPSSYAPIKQKT